MKLETALALLEDHERTIDLSHNHALHAAIHLGIEALKAITIYRSDCITKPLFHLPGEAKE